MPSTRKIYDLLSETTALDNETRAQWLVRYEKLNSRNQAELVRELTNLEKEIQGEEEAHLHRFAEITSKYESRLKSFAREHNLLDLTPATPSHKLTKSMDLLDEMLDAEFIRELNDFDNS